MSDRPDKPYNWHEYAIEIECSLLEQDKYVSELKAKVAELEQIINVQDGELDDFRGIENTGQLNVKQKLEIRDLEQQADILESVRKHNVRQKRLFGSKWTGGHVIENLQVEERNLREQAKQLKGGEL